jgi:hypothetical protein
MNKITKRLLASAVVALAVTGVAEARTAGSQDNIIDSNSQIKPDGGGEFIFNLVNYKGGNPNSTIPSNTFTMDLGITVKQFLLNPTQNLTFNFNDSNFQSFLANREAGDRISWGVAAGYGALNDPALDGPFAGFYTTAKDGVPTSFDPDWAQIGNTMGKHDLMLTSVNSAYTNGLPGGGPISLNESTFATDGNNGYTGQYGDDLQQALPFFGQGDVGQTMRFVHEGVNQTDFDTGVINVFANSWKFDIEGSQGKLGFAGGATVVPLPAAVWMFGAGLMGMLRLNRRKAD